MPGGSYEQLRGPHFRGQPRVDINGPRGSVGSGAAFAGWTTLGSGETSLAVLTTAVKSDSLIFTQVRAEGATVDVTSGTPIDVRTISPGVGFTLGPRSGAALNPAVALRIMWMIYRTS